MSGDISRKDIAILWGNSGGRCAMPECRIKLIQEKTENDPYSIIGEMAHIKGKKSGAARFDPTLTAEQRNNHNNLILLCPNHHKIVDDQHKWFTAEKLYKIKEEHEKWLSKALTEEIMNITFQELDVVTKFLTSDQIKLETSYTLIPPKEKIDKNSLSLSIGTHITRGLVQVKQVDEFIEKYPDIYFGERLKQGFVEEYTRLKNEGLTSDALFYALLEFASQKNKDVKIMAAGLTVLTYLFEKCEVFEK
ncbi:MAG: hypothetical protein FWH37_07965 [Candidatus Bathyarchaeota archaeon]|nr:hypothetical protein [Candidatus Termiticorpusculum sp.]